MIPIIHMYFGQLVKRFTISAKIIVWYATVFPTFYVAEPPKVMSQPTNQEDVLPGKAVSFSVQATGTPTLKYQWQWKPFVKKGEQNRWQNLSNKVGTELKLSPVQACNAGYYQCVVSNCAGRETSQCVSLTVGKHVHCRYKYILVIT